MSIRRRSRTRSGTRSAADSAPVGITTANLVLGPPPRQASSQQVAVKRVQSRPGAALRSALDFRVDDFVPAAGDYVHEAGLGLRFSSLSFKPTPKRGTTTSRSCHSTS